MRNKSTILPAMACLVFLTALSGAARAGYKDQPCTNCGNTVVEQHVNVQVIHIPRPAMLHIPEARPRQRVHVHYRHYYPGRTQQNIEYIDRRQPLTRAHHQRHIPDAAAPEARPLAGIREGLSRLFSR